MIVTLAGRPVATHERCWAKHQSITDPAHHAAALALAHTAAHRPPQPGDQDVQQVEERDLSVYDTAFGITDGQGA